MIRAAVVGYGNIGHSVLEAILSTSDIQAAGIVSRSLTEEKVQEVPVVRDIHQLKNVDVAILCSPSRAVPDLAAALLEQKTGREMEEILAGSGASPLTFTDTQDPIVSMLSALGVVNGKGNGLFEPQADITREEAAVMLWRLAQQLGTVEPNRSQITFSDAGQISSWAKQAVSVISACEYNGNAIMNGTGNNQFSPRQQYTREQAILTMLRLGQYMD